MSDVLLSEKGMGGCDHPQYGAADTRQLTQTQLSFWLYLCCFSVLF